MTRTCDTCDNHLGGGCCRLNLESECGGGEFEAWEGGAVMTIGGVMVKEVVVTGEGNEVLAVISDTEIIEKDGVGVALIKD